MWAKFTNTYSITKTNTNTNVNENIKTNTNINGRDQLSQYRAKFTDTQYGPTISKGKTLTSFLLEWGEFSKKVFKNYDGFGLNEEFG